CSHIARRVLRVADNQYIRIVRVFFLGSEEDRLLVLMTVFFRAVWEKAIGIVRPQMLVEMFHLAIAGKAHDGLTACRNHFGQDGGQGAFQWLSLQMIKAYFSHIIWGQLT